MFRRILVGVFILLCALFSLAQEAQADSPPVIEPDDILFDPTLPTSSSPLVNADDDTRALYYFDPITDSWTAYPYPDGLAEVGDARYFIRARSDGTYLINPDGFWRFNQNSADKTWLFKPTDGSFSPPEAACGLPKDLPGEGKWIVLKNDETGSSHLCFTENGQFSPPIPVEEPDSCLSQWYKPVVTSPDGEWVLVFCGGLDFTAYSYHVETEVFRHLGTSEPRFNENVEVVQWLESTQAIIHAFPSWNPPANVYYVADMTQSGSLEFVTRDLYAAPFYFDDPPHLEWMPCEFVRCAPPPVPGGLRYYDFVDRQLTIFPKVEGIHGISNLIPDGTEDRLYRSLNFEDDSYRNSAPSATLIRFNYRTGERYALFTGEIEWIDSFSPDGRYVVLYMGNNDQVVTNYVLSENQTGYSPDGNAEIAIFDLRTNVVIYQAHGSAWEPYGYNPFELFTSGYNPLPVTWINEDTFFIQGVSETHHQVIKVTEDVETVADFEDIVTSQLSPDKQRILMRDNAQQIKVYDISADEIIPLIKPSAVEQYDISVDWQDATTLLVTIFDDLDLNNPTMLANWHVSLVEK